jgi:hypothetical protein
MKSVFVLKKTEEKGIKNNFYTFFVFVLNSDDTSLVFGLVGKKIRMQLWRKRKKRCIKFFFSPFDLIISEQKKP